jgi:hypothetical protein
MPASLVSVADLKAILGIGDLYPDATLEQIGQAATDVVLAYLSQNRERVLTTACTVSAVDPAVGTTIVFTVSRATLFQVGQIVEFGLTAGTILTGEQLEITEVDSDLLEITAESATVLEPGVYAEKPVIPAASVYDADSINVYANVDEVLEAVTAVAVDMFQSRIAPGGQMEAVDFTPGPYRMGRSLLTRVSGLLGRWMDVGSLVG